MQRRTLLYVVGIGGVLGVLALVLRQQQRSQAPGLQVGGSQDSPSGVVIRIPEPNCSYFGIPGLEFPARVVGVRDADDLIVQCHDTSGTPRQLVVRLAEIDCPEFGQPYHAEAKAVLSGTALGREVRIRFREINDFSGRNGICRIVGWVLLPDGTDVSRLLLARGLAWHYERYSDHKDELEAIERQARSQRLGLWADDRPISPWDWRQGVRPSKTGACLRLRWLPEPTQLAYRVA
jgi:endonuclease YncB( thermonuclease family)